MPSNKKTKPWISNVILAKIDEKNKILRKYINCKNAVRKSELHVQFKLLKNDITHLTRTGKKEYYQKYFSENKNNLQKIWKGIKEIINIKSIFFTIPLVYKLVMLTLLNQRKSPTRSMTISPQLRMKY